MIDSSVKMGQDLDVRFQELRGLILRVLIGGIQGHFGPVMLLVMISRVILDDFLAASLVSAWTIGTDISRFDVGVRKARGV